MSLMEWTSIRVHSIRFKSSVTAPVGPQAQAAGADGRASGGCRKAPFNHRDAACALQPQLNTRRVTGIGGRAERAASLIHSSPSLRDAPASKEHSIQCHGFAFHGFALRPIIFLSPTAVDRFRSSARATAPHSGKRPWTTELRGREHAAVPRRSTSSGLL
jgi:hypothetical protein